MEARKLNPLPGGLLGLSSGESRVRMLWDRTFISKLFRGSLSKTGVKGILHLCQTDGDRRGSVQSQSKKQSSLLLLVNQQEINQCVFKMALFDTKSFVDNV